MQNEPPPMTPDELAQRYKELRETADGMAQDLVVEKRRKTIWKIFAFVIACLCLYETKSKTVWLPVADSQQMCVLRSDWWGLKAQAYYPVWRNPTGESGEYSQRWCIKSPDDTWRAFYDGRGKAPKYTYPQINYSTYF